MERSGKEPRFGGQTVLRWGAALITCISYVTSCQCWNVPRWALVSWFVKWGNYLLYRRVLSTWEALDTATVIWYMVWNSTNASLPWKQTPQQRQDFLPLLILGKSKVTLSALSPTKENRFGVCPSGLPTWGNQDWKRGLSGGWCFMFFPVYLGSQEPTIIQSGFFDINYLFVQEYYLSRWKVFEQSSPKRQPFPEDCMVWVIFGGLFWFWKAAGRPYLHKTVRGSGIAGRGGPGIQEEKEHERALAWLWSNSQESGQTESAELAATERSCRDF